MTFGLHTHHPMLHLKPRLGQTNIQYLTLFIQNKQTMHTKKWTKIWINAALTHTGHLPSYCANSPAEVGNFQLYRSPDKPQHKFTEDMCFVKPKTNTCLLLWLINLWSPIIEIPQVLQEYSLSSWVLCLCFLRLVLQWYVQ